MSFPCRLRCFPSAWLSLVICRVSRTETIEPKHPISSEFRPGSLILGTLPVQHKLAADAVLDNTACVREEPELAFCSLGAATLHASQREQGWGVFVRVSIPCAYERKPSPAVPG